MRLGYILRNSLFLLTFFVFSFNNSLYSAVDVPTPESATDAKAVEGMDLFKANCAACHAVDKKVIGPALNGVWDRWESEESLHAWIKNSQAFLATGDAYANNLYNEYNKSVMQSFPTLTDEQIANILVYVKGKANGIDPGAPAADPNAATTATPSNGGNSKYVLIGIVLLLLILALALISITNKLDKVVNKTEETDVATTKKSRNKKIVKALLAIAVIAFILNIANGAIHLGRSQDYAPEQPIRFSHALHVGQNQIECQYCHSGVEKSRHASIPGTQVCMNCHKSVQEGPKYGKEEIAKIYDYAGWNPDAMKFERAPKNIEWVKIHNLPDHVYFNHSQHVVAGKVECQTCHGKVEEYEVMKQFAPLSMGWCINCHRETNVQFADNNYYSVFEKYHEEIKKGEREGVTVEDIGGTECQKCHY
ncbi:MAG: c-type cytochrome [Chitinophagales bacterium]|nr:c-type cytochrome [Chitinophagales bacterium]